MEEKCINSKMYTLSKWAEALQILIISIGVFLVPMIVPQFLSSIFGAKSVIASNSQYVVGTIVNTLLIVAGINVAGWKNVIGIVTLPSISAICSGLIFKTAAIYSVYMVPAIWVGNFLIIYLYKYLFVKKNLNYVVASVAGIVAKVAVIFVCFSILAYAGIIPQKVATVMQVTMGSNQAITATMGAVVAYIVIGVMGLIKENK